MTHFTREKSWLRAALRTSAATSALIAGMTMSAYAQDEAPPPEEGEDTIIVTGSRIPVASNLDSASPISQLSSDEFTMRGTSKVEDIINTLPQAFAAQGSNISNGSSGTATINLRGLGSDRTLVMIDGRRMPYGSAPFTTAADVNQIPAPLVERVEVVTGGASAVYGSDAMAGAVNFIMKRDFEGLRFDGQFSFYQHNNENTGLNENTGSLTAADLLQASGFPAPDDSVLDGFGKDFSVVAGANSPDGRGNVTAYFVYHHNKEVLQGDRDYSACAFGLSINAASAEDIFCAGSSTTHLGRFTDFGINEAFGLGTSFDLQLNQGSGDFEPFSTLYNFAPPNHYMRPDERFLFGVFSHYEINEHADVYFDLMYHDDRTIAQIAETGTFFNTSSVNCGNPFLTAAQAAAIDCSAADITNNESTVLFIGKRNVEGGPRQDDLRHTSFRGVFGVRGETGIEGVTYDVYGAWSNVHFANVYNNDMSVSRLTKAINVIIDDRPTSPTFGQPICQSTYDGTDAGCVPYNVFTPGGITQEALDYILVPGFADANNTQQMVSGAFTIDMGAYDGRSPWANDAIGLVLGAEYRRDTMDFDSSLTFCDRFQPTPNSDLTGQGGATCPVSGAQENYDGFAEMRLPLIQDKPLIHDLSGEFGYRYSEYEFGGSTHTWKLLGDFAPTADVKFRGGWQRAVRAPNVIELFLPQRIALFDTTDPCEGAAPSATLAQCQNSGLSAAQYGSLPGNPAEQYNSLIRGNTELEPEEADTYTIGAVLTPSFVPNLVLSVDYFDIFVDKFISTVSPITSLNQCIETGDPFFCDAINRDAAGSVWITPQGYVDAGNLNTGSLATTGIDINAAYNFDFEDLGMPGWGGVAFDFVGTHLISLEIEELPDEAVPIYDCAGYRGDVCGTPNPRWRHKFRTTFLTPWHLDLSVSWRMFAAVEDFVDGPGGLPGAAAEDYGAEHYLDLAARYQLLDNLALRAGVNNILDNDPPVSSDVGAGSGNGNTNPQVYDSLGRYFFFSATVDF